MANDTKTKFSPEELDSMLASVTSEVIEFLRKDEAELAKAVKDAPAEESEGSEGPAAPEASAPAPDEAPPADAAPPMDDGSAPAEAAPPEGSAPADGAPAPAPDAMAQDQAIEPAPTVEQLQAEYSQLDPEALKLHYLACKGAIMMAMGQAGPEASAPAPDASAPPMAPPGGAPAPEASAPPAFKAEMGAGKKIDLSDGNGGEIKAGKLGKSESDQRIEALELQLKKSEQTMLQLVEIVAKPLRKSVKGVSELQFITKEGDAPVAAPSSTMTKAEITSKLREKAKTTLSKSDRDLMNQFVVGAVDITKIEHLLK